MKLALAVSVVVLAVAPTTACGGGDDGSLSAEEFRDRAEAVCRDVEEADVPPPSDASDFDRFVDESADVIEGSADEFHALEPPEELQERWDEYLELIDRAVSMFKDLLAEVEGASPDEIAQLGSQFQAEFEELEIRGHEIERELGLDECVD